MNIDLALRRVAEPQPKIQPRAEWHAATALVLCVDPEPRFVVIRRAVRHGDPWSGQAALPGGRSGPEDRDIVATARRETVEEVGVAVGDPVGRLDEIGGRFFKGVVSPVVFVVDSAEPLVPDPAEVAAAHWIPLSLLSDPAARVRYPVRFIGPWPGWGYRTGAPAPHDELIIWGLTHRILSNFYGFGS